MITEYLTKLCWDFAHEQYATSKKCYVTRNQPEKTGVENIFQGKICEWYVYQHLKALGYTCTRPDMEIYVPGEKSYDADLIANNKNHIHVKSCKETRWGLSWVMEINEPIVAQPQAYDYLSLCVYYSPSDIRLIKWLNAKSAIYKQTRLFKPSKCAIYWQDVAGV
jgi:hypothetical protein